MSCVLKMKMIEKERLLNYLYKKFQKKRNKIIIISKKHSRAKLNH